MSMHKNSRIGIVLKIGVILSAGIGIFTQGDYSSVFYYFTIQSNIWIAAAALVFVIFDINAGGRGQIPQALYAIKFMFTASICLTFLVFSLILSPLMPKSYLFSLPNLLLHNLTAFLALADFILCDKNFRSGKRTWLLASVMPGIYLVFALMLSRTGARFSGKTVPYFFLDYEKLGWFRIGSSGLGVVYWVAMIFLLTSLIGMGLALSLEPTHGRESAKEVRG
jgi:hypothetical protein